MVITWNAGKACKVSLSTTVKCWQRQKRRILPVPLIRERERERRPQRNPTPAKPKPTDAAPHFSFRITYGSPSTFSLIFFLILLLPFICLSSSSLCAIDDLRSRRRRSGEMERRARRNGAQVSPERCVVWTEPSSKHQMQGQQRRKVPVVYYLCKNSLLEHPHFVEVPFSSPEGLYLRDVINRLVALRGNRMPTMYSWSCKRSYRNGFVWQDLAEDDLIPPVQGNEYVLKGSQLLDQTPADTLHDTNNDLRPQKNRSLVRKEHSIYSSKEEASSSLSPVIAMRGSNPLSLPRLAPSHSIEDDHSPPCHRSSIPLIGSASSGECNVLMSSGAQDASTKTEDRVGSICGSVNDGLPDPKFNEIQQKDAQPNDFMKEKTSPTPMLWGASSVGNMNTMVSLLRAELNKLDSIRIVKEEGVDPSKVKNKRTNALLQLITCSSMMLRELDCQSVSSRRTNFRMDEKDSLSKRLDKKCMMHKEQGGETLPAFCCTSSMSKGAATHIL